MGNPRETLRNVHPIKNALLASQLLVLSCGPFIPPPKAEIHSTPTSSSFSEPATFGRFGEGETFDLSQIPQGRENEIQKELTKLQEMLRFYINTSEQLLGKDLADHYKETIDSVGSSADGTIYKTKDNLNIGKPLKPDSATSFMLKNPYIHTAREVSGQTGKPLNDYLWLILNKEGKLEDKLPDDEIMSTDDVKKLLKIFKVPSGWINVEEDTINHYTIDTLYLFKFKYPDGSSVAVWGTTKGHFSIQVQAGTTNAYIAP